MTDYEALIAEGDHFRRDEDDNDAAINCYQQALDIGGPCDRYVTQMIGVSYQGKADYLEALKWYTQALEGADDFARGNILRDMAESYSGMEDFDAALKCLSESLEKLPYSKYPIEHAATLGFLGRTEVRMGFVREGVKHLATADTILSHEDNRYIELYNKLHYSNALSRNKQPLKSRAVALAALRLSRKYGAKRKHFPRSVVLLIGGYRLDDYLRQRRHR